MGESAISVAGLRKKYRQTVAVNGVSFEVEQGEIFGIIGPNGSGKTTSVECIQGLRRPDAGTIRVMGLDPVAQRTDLRRIIGCQLQDSALPDRLRVWEAIDLFASLAPDGAGARLLLDQWGLEDKRKAAFASLSGGQQQRLFVALALVNNPRVVFLDEMTTGLDPAARRVAWDLIQAVRNRGATVVLVTHFMDEAERLCDRLALVREGRIVAQGSPASLVRDHGGGLRVVFSTARQDLGWLADVPGARTVSTDGTQVTVQGEGPLLALTAAALVEHGIVPDDLRLERGTLEDVFVALTGSTGEVA